MGKTLILKSDRGSFENFYLTRMQGDSVTTRAFFRSMGELVRYISILHIQKLKLPFQSIWYASWKKRLKEFDTVIVFDRNYNWDILNYIHKKNPNCRIIVWYWNPIAKCERIPIKYRVFCEEWSFDLKDCEKYSLNYNVQFTFKELFEDSDKTIKYDLYFVGVDKGRSSSLIKLKEYMNKLGKKVKFIIIKDKTSTSSNVDFSLPIPYEKNLEYLKESKCVVEMVQDKQSGLTLRVVEALFLKKKIITNNASLNQYDFYNENNIFIFDESLDCMHELELFMNQRYTESDKLDINKYDFSGWLKNFQL